MIKQSRLMGLETIVVDSNPSAPGFEYSDFNFYLDTKDVEGCLRVAKEFEIDGVTSIAAHHALKTIGAINDELSLNGHSGAVTESCINKQIFREKLDAAKNLSPKYRECNSLSEVIAFAEGVGCPIVTKPTDGSGSRGMASSNDMNELNKNYEYAMTWSSSKKVIAEEFIEGPEFSVESLTEDGKTEIVAITDKRTSGYPFFVEIGHRTPSMVSGNEKKSIESAVVQTFNLLLFENGPAHTEVILSPNGPKIVEVNPRPSGDHIWSKMVPLSCNVNILEQTIRSALGEKLVFDKTVNAIASITYFFSEKDAVVKDIVMAPEINEMKELHELQLDISPGEKVKKVEQSRDRFGYFICVSDSYEKDDEVTKFINKNINFVNYS